MSDFQTKLDSFFKNVDLQIDDGISLNDYDIFEEIRNNLISVREEKRITQKKLSSMTGLTQSNISKIEKGLSKPSIETLKKIADATGKRLVIDFVERGELL